MGSYLGRENRQHPRVAAEATVFIKINGKMFPGSLKDLSVRSLCVKSNAPLPLGAAVDVVVMHASRNAAISGEIERIGNGQIVITTTAKSVATLRSLFQALKTA